MHGVMIEDEFDMIEEAKLMAEAAAIIVELDESRKPAWTACGCFSPDNCPA